MTPFYVLLYMYLDAIMPNVYGIRQSCCFCLRKRRQIPDSEADEEEANEVRGLILNQPVALRMKNLSKYYGSLRAADSLNFTVYKNEIFTLLGHNGAGKTTAINMLTGMVQPSRGDAEILGRSLVNEINAVRQEIGLC